MRDASAEVGLDTLGGELVGHRERICFGTRFFVHLGASVASVMQ